ncbi:MAG: DoxX family protein [Myxococcaceae bacterium]|nr:DoxX family protein [Myxococcaceae bacterium]
MTTTTPRRVAPFDVHSGPPLRFGRDAGLFLLRLAAGVPLFFHGAQKLFGWFGGGGLSGFADFLAQLGVPWPSVSAVLAAVTEVGGGALLVVGLGFRGLVPVVVTMLVAAATSARHGYDVMRGGAEYPLTLALLVAALALLGPGAFSLASVRRAS